MKPLFVPLKTEYYEAFKDGSKTEELRLYGKRWNEKTCFVGREIILSKGYGKQNRMKGRICKFKKQHASTIGLKYKKEILEVFDGLKFIIARISITDLKPI